MGMRIGQGVLGGLGGRGMMPSPPAVNLEEDVLMCVCGNDKFVQMVSFVKIKSPIIDGTNSMTLASPPQLMEFRCSSCGRKLNPVDFKTKKEIQDSAVEIQGSSVEAQ